MAGLRPLSVGELLDSSIKTYRSRAKTLMLAVAVPVIPVVALTTLVSLSIQPESASLDPLSGTPTTPDGGDIALQLTGSLVAVALTLVATSLATAACFRSISGAYVGDDPDWRTSLRFGLSRVWSVLGLTILTSLATFAGVLVCCFGVVFPLAWFAVAMPILLVEGSTAAASMGRSRRLAEGYFWRVLGVVLLGMILAQVFQGVVSAPLFALLFTDPSPTAFALVSFVTQSIATVLVTPFTAALTMALYVDLRVRKEGFDLALWAQRLGASMPPGGFPGQPGAAPPFPTGPGYPYPSYPGQQPGYPYPGQPGYPSPPYPGQQPGYPPQPYPGQQPGYPPQPYPGQPGYPPQSYPGQPGYPPQSYPGQQPGYPPQPYPGSPPPPPPPPPSPPPSSWPPPADPDSP